MPFRNSTVVNFTAESNETMIFCVIYRVQAEVDEILGNKDRLGAEDLEKLEYIEQV